MTEPASPSADELLAKQLSALAHPIRLKIMRAACRHNNPVCSATDASRLLDMSLPLISYHARVLRDADLLSTIELIQRRGAVQHRYQPTKRGQQLTAILMPNGEPANAPTPAQT